MVYHKVGPWQVTADSSHLLEDNREYASFRYVMDGPLPPINSDQRVMLVVKVAAGHCLSAPWLQRSHSKTCNNNAEPSKDLAI